MSVCVVFGYNCINMIYVYIIIIVTPMTSGYRKHTHGHGTQIIFHKHKCGKMSVKNCICIRI